MAYFQDRQTDVGTLINGTFQTLLGIRREVGFYFGAFLIAGLIVDIFEPLRGLVSVLTFLGYFAAQYWLYREALSKAGIAYDQRFKVFSFFGMAFILIFPIYFGFAFLVVPGVLLASKWIMAPTFLVAEEEDLFTSIGGSWKASQNNLWPIAGAFTVITIIWMVGFVVLAALAAAYKALIGMGGLEVATGETTAIEWAAIHLLPVLLLGLSVTAYRELAGTDKDLVAVFE